MSEQGNRAYHRQKITVVFFLCAAVLLFLFFRLVYLMVARADYYSAKATELHERERSIKAARGRIVDRNGTVIADNKTVCTISGWRSILPSSASRAMWIKRWGTGSGSLIWPA